MCQNILLPQCAKGDIENSVLATGRIDAIERVNVGAQVSGQLKSLKVKQGDHVTKGQLIAEIDDLPQRNDLRNAEAALNEVKAELQSKQALLKQAELRFKRQLRMLRENASSHEDFESAEAMLATTRAELLSLNAKLVQAQIEVDKKKLALEYTRVVAPNGWNCYCHCHSARANPLTQTRVPQQLLNSLVWMS
ncbi:Putative type I secretion membrane-fusion protein EtsA [Escherichia coli]|uniref:Type I secretion membrane-fusion protein EtsA n=1 Tax=Escherichia coli TaxID=562 RepID=A0A376ZWY9_ECOLX|nr:Putative type I secretion membrane-fusion protein EtsA [Escherichia coli]